MRISRVVEVLTGDADPAGAGLTEHSLFDVVPLIGVLVDGWLMDRHGISRQYTCISQDHQEAQAISMT